MRKVNEAKFEIFAATYQKELLKAVKEHPEEYAYGGTDDRIVAVAVNMMKCLRTNSHNHSGRAFKATCKALGIKHTRSAIDQFILEECATMRELASRFATPE